MSKHFTIVGRVYMNRKSNLSARLLLLLVAVSAFPSVVMAAAIKDISFAALPGNKVQITIKGDGRLPQPASFNTDNPPRLAIDFNGVGSKIAKQARPVGIGLVRSVQALAAGNRTRVVVNLTASAPYDVRANGNEAVITVSGGTNEGVAEAGSTQAAQARVRPKAMASSRYGVRNIDFRRGDSGEGKLLITLADPNTVVDMKKQGADIIVDIAGTRLPPRLMRKLDVTDFATPVQTIKAEPEGQNTRITIEAGGLYEHLAYQTDNNYVVELRPLTAQEEAQLREKTYTGERLSLNFQDIEVRSVLQLLADFTGMNLVVSDAVRGNVTLRLQNVPWDHALDIILKAKNLDMRQKNNVMRIAPAAEIAAAEKQELESMKQVEELAPLHSEWFRLNFAKAEAFATMIRGSGRSTNQAGVSTSRDSFLSERGSVTVDSRTNTLLVKDTDESLDSIRQLIRKLDIPTQQVLIESRIVTATDDFSKDLGVKLGFAGHGVNQTTSDPNAQHAVVGGGIAGDLDMTAIAGPFITSAAPNESLMVNLPAAAPTSAINFVVGRAFSHIIRLELSAMQSEGKGEIISSPRVMTADRNQATIKQGFEIPYQQATSSGATSVSFKEAVLQLDVTPQITPDDRVIMDLTVSQDEPDFARAVLGTPPIQKREVTTQVLVNNGETVVLGGVFTESTTLRKNQTPVLGDLPYLGNLFKQKQQTTDHRELLIFVTPKIIKEGLGQIGLRPGKGK
jgi:type IV pilus assembly protein PilQ